MEVEGEAAGGGREKILMADKVMDANETGQAVEENIGEEMEDQSSAMANCTNVRKLGGWIYRYTYSGSAGRVVVVSDAPEKL